MQVGVNTHSISPRTFRLKSTATFNAELWVSSEHALKLQVQTHFFLDRELPAKGSPLKPCKIAWTRSSSGLLRSSRASGSWASRATMRAKRRRTRSTKAKLAHSPTWVHPEGNQQLLARATASQSIIQKIFSRLIPGPLSEMTNLDVASKRFDQHDDKLLEKR